MTVKQLILNNSDKVRRDSSLMAFYIESFFEAFGYKPSCASCSFSNDWNKLVRFVNKFEVAEYINQNKNTMSTFRLKKTTNTILFYVKDGRTIRKYDNKIDEDFAVAYLTNGTEEEIEQRKKLFAVLPGESQKEAAVEILNPDLESKSDNTEEKENKVTKAKKVSKKK